MLLFDSDAFACAVLFAVIAFEAVAVTSSARRVAVKFFFVVIVPVS